MARSGKHDRHAEHTAKAPTGTQPTPTAPEHGLLALQRLAGNRAVSRMLGERSPVHDVIASSGRPLATGIRTEMEDRLGHDFSDVRVHTDAAADTSARAVGARAYTSGNHVVFERGGFDTTSRQGKTTLAHELTHVVQQRRGPVSATPVGGGVALSDPSDAFERAAERTAEQVMRAPVQRRTADDDARHAGHPGRSAGTAVQRYKDTDNNLYAGLLRRIMFGAKSRRAGPEDLQDPGIQNDLDNTEKRAVAIESDGHTLRGTFYEPVHGHVENGGKAILLLTGSHGSAESQGLHMVHSYLMQGAAVLSVNYRGFGASSKGNKATGKGGTPTEAGVYADALAMYDHLRHELHASYIIVHGFSLGGPIAAHVAQKRDPKALVLDRAMHSSFRAANEMNDEGKFGRFAGNRAKNNLGEFDLEKELDQIAGSVSDVKKLMPIIFAITNDTMRAGNLSSSAAAKQKGLSVTDFYRGGRRDNQGDAHMDSAYMAPRIAIELRQMHLL